MKKIFNANIEENGLGGWLIRVTNEETKEEIFCKNIDEFSNFIEYVGSVHGGDIQINWSRADNLTNEHFFEVRKEMAKLNKELSSD